MSNVEWFFDVLVYVKIEVCVFSHPLTGCVFHDAQLSRGSSFQGAYPWISSDSKFASLPISD
jgi:hypothetical protein